MPDLIGGNRMPGGGLAFREEEVDRGEGAPGHASGGAFDRRADLAWGAAHLAGPAARAMALELEDLDQLPRTVVHARRVRQLRRGIERAARPACRDAEASRAACRPCD